MSQFESCLLAEGVRAVEGTTPVQGVHAAKGNEQSFETLVFERATEYDQRLQISALFLHFKKLTRNFFRLFAALLFILGGIAVQKMLFTDQLSSINFFWAFALFFIPNIFMFLVWLFLFMKPELLQNSSLTRFSLSAIKLFEGRFNKQSLQRDDYWPLFRCYFELFFSKKMGKYNLSKLTHLLWLSYFSGATLMSIVMLATHQVDFVWQTSILSADSFQWLTQMLSSLPQLFGFPVPSIEQIQQSHIGTGNVLDAENRRLVWSSLLISSLLLYGVLPRLILLLLMSYRLKQQTSNFSLDLSLPYYVQLRQILKPNKTKLGITDADEDAIEEAATVYAADNGTASTQLPNSFYAIAIELSASQLLLAEKHEQKTNQSQINLTNVCDHAAQQQLLTELQESENQYVALYVALKRVPDRGLKRFIREMTSIQGKQFHLFLIVESAHNRQRDNDWYQLADDVGIALDNILHIELEGDANE